MRIIIIQPWMSYRGAEAVSVALARGLVHLGNYAKLITVYIDEKHPPVGIDEVEVVTAPAPFAFLCRIHPFLFLLFGPILLFALVMRFSKGADILNAHNPPSLLIASIVGKFRGIPVVWTCHSLPVSKKWYNRISALDFFAQHFSKSRIEKWAIRNSKRLIANSGRTAEELRSTYRVHAEILYPPLSDKPWRNSFVSKRSNTPLRIVSVGRLDRRKNHKAAIDTLAKVQQIIPEVTLTIVGEGPLMSELRAYVQEIGLENSIEFVGYIPPLKLQELYGTSSIALMAAFNEPWGLTPFEALSTGCLPIVSSQSGAAEVIASEQIGIVTDPNPEQFAMAIITILRNQVAYDALIIRGKDYLERKLYEMEYARENERIYKDVIKEHLSMPF